MWISRRGGQRTLRYGAGETLDREVRVKPARAVEGEDTEHIYEARLTGLRPGISYRYELDCGSAGSFRTFSDEPGRLTFIAYGDTRSNPEVAARVAGCFDGHDPAFILHTGDMLKTGRHEEWKPYFFDPLRGVTDRIPLWPARGNHEGDGESFRQVFSLPDGRTWYSFDCGNAHFTVLDSNGWRHQREESQIAVMREWCEHDLAASRADWKIAMYHQPSYELGWRRDDWGREDFLPLFRKYGVDLTLTGHAHTYQRFHPMITRGENQQHPITHIVTAGGGAPLDKELKWVPHLAARALEYHYMVFTIESGRLEARVLTPEGQLLDSFSITKDGGSFAAEHLADALWESDFEKPEPLERPHRDMRG